MGAGVYTQTLTHSITRALTHSLTHSLLATNQVVVVSWEPIITTEKTGAGGDDGVGDITHIE